MKARYETLEMAELWSDESQFNTWLKIELAVCEARHELGEISDDDIRVIRNDLHYGSVSRVREIEKSTRHEMVAFVNATLPSVPQELRHHIHKGLGSADIIDTGLSLSLRKAIQIISDELKTACEALSECAEEHRSTLCIARTHGVHAEPMIFGVRVAGWYADVQRSIERLETQMKDMEYGKLSGAIGVFSHTTPELEERVLKRLGLRPEPLATQVVPRDRHASLLATLALMATSIERIATNIRALHRTEIREAEESFGKGQAGSSAMPHKRNPITCERLCGLARVLRGYMTPAFENVVVWDERDVSQLEAERIIFEDALCLAHYMARSLSTLMQNVRFHPERMAENISLTKGMVFSQSVLGVLLEAGIARDLAYDAVKHATGLVHSGAAEGLKEALEANEEIMAAISQSDLNTAFETDRFAEHVDALYQRVGISANAAEKS